MMAANLSRTSTGSFLPSWKTSSGKLSMRSRCSFCLKSPRISCTSPESSSAVLVSLPSRKSCSGSGLSVFRLLPQPGGMTRAARTPLPSRSGGFLTFSDGVCSRHLNALLALAASMKRALRSVPSVSRMSAGSVRARRALERVAEDQREHRRQDQQQHEDAAVAVDVQKLLVRHAGDALEIEAAVHGSAGGADGCEDGCEEGMRDAKRQ